MANRVKVMNVDVDVDVVIVAKRRVRQRSEASRTGPTAKTGPQKSWHEYCHSGYRHHQS